MNNRVFTRVATMTDLPSILAIYNQGIEDRIATLEVEAKNMDDMQKWFHEHGERYTILVVEQEEEVVGWASLNPYSNRCAYDGVADLSIYIRRDFRGKGVGTKLLQALEKIAVYHRFYKIILFTLPFNQMGQGLYRKNGYREVGILMNQGMLDGQLVNVMIMEKILIKNSCNQRSGTTSKSDLS